ncbi:MAG TPA: SMP-30/gluconolactonase/LRE family protein [Flavitalea sp.]|nr:SMP-30/gluconolactonase/LRE family protein [Flavitalea sp.]
MHARPVFEHTSLLGEGPVWDSITKFICWVDIENGHIHQYNTLSKEHYTISVHQPVGCIATCHNKYFIAGLKSGFGLVHRISGEIKMLEIPEKHLPRNRFNDGKCDPQGRFWAGSMSLDDEKGSGSLYMLDDGKVSTKISGVSISNGLAWSTKNVFYYIDTPTRGVDAWNYDPETGNISGKKRIINIPESEGWPDGMTIDAEGMLWIGHWDGWKVSRWDPSKGKKISEIMLPVARVTACTFGGTSYQDLYITTAKTGLTVKALAEQPMAGCIFVVENCGSTGLPTVEFNG